MRVGRVCVVNQPSFFKYLWKIIRLLLHSHVRDRVVVLGTEFGALTRFIAPQYIPTFLQGECDIDKLEPWWTKDYTAGNVSSK